MNNFERPSSVPEVSPTPEELKSNLSDLRAMERDLQQLAKTSGENIDVELGSDEYIDQGYTARLREEVEPAIKAIEQALADIDDQSALQRNLNI